MAPDDIKDDNLTDLAETHDTKKGVTRSPDASKPHKEVGPESEVRGGPEAPED